MLHVFVLQSRTIEGNMQSAGPRRQPALLFSNDKKWLRNLYQRIWTRRIAL
jgi:hypothetical protein